MGTRGPSGAWLPRAAPPAKVRLLACAACCLLLQLHAGGPGLGTGSGLRLGLGGQQGGGGGAGRALAARRLLQGGGGGEALQHWRFFGGGEHPEWARHVPSLLTGHDGRLSQCALHVCYMYVLKRLPARVACCASQDTMHMRVLHDWTRMSYFI